MMLLRPALILLLSATAAHADYFMYGRYIPMEGKVGQALMSDATFSVEDMPERCVPEWKSISIAGVLPPGLDIANSFSSAIGGTPTTAGDWPVVVTIHQLGCSVGDAGHFDRAIKVNFHIAP